MSMDRFVKVTLALIVLLLGLNCAKEIKLSANSGNSSAGSNDSGSRNSTRSANASGKQFGPLMFETAVEAAAPPAFIEVGKSYYFQFAAGSNPIAEITVKVISIDKDSGWLRVEFSGGTHSWININQVFNCHEA